jgi:hypothetical protein
LISKTKQEQEQQPQNQRGVDAHTRWHDFQIAPLLTVHEIFLENCETFGYMDISTEELFSMAITEFDVRTHLLMNSDIGLFNCQSGFEGANLMRGTDTSTAQNVTFSDQHNNYTYEVESEMDPTRMLQDSKDAELGNFFSRPIKIAELEWGTGTSLFQDIDPWSLYWNNPRVINRISNYNLLRAKMHVKIVINGNGFLYGRAIASYLPLNDADTYSVNAALIPETIVQASQQPHIYLNPTLSSGGDMILPFYYYKNYLNIPGIDWAAMGLMTIRSINDLKHANGASEDVTISVFAWAEDVAMSVLTTVEPATIGPQLGDEDESEMEPQSGAEIDEANAKGAISGPATAISRIAGQLALVPALKPYAMATSTLANGVAGMAKLFGFSRPSVTADPAPYKPTTISELALTTTPDNPSKFAVDDKQELSIDPRIAGLGSTDPLSIVDIARKESYLTKFTWATDTAPETMLWNCRVSPALWAEQGTPTAYHLPACCVAALPFRYWTGTMKFRFQVVASAFHKGRLKIVYDPQYIATNEYNVNYLRVIDIADTTDFTIEIGNGQEISLIDHANPGIDAVTTLYSTTAYASTEPGNGVIGVQVVNELTTPNSTANNDVEVNVFVSAGDDFEVFVPEDIFQTLVFKPQSGLEQDTVVADGIKDDEIDKPEDQTTMKLGPDLINLSDLNKVYTGESIKSFRQLLKRYNLHTTLGAADTSTSRFDFERRAFPYLRGNVTGAINTTGALNSYNYCNTLLLHWVTGAFQGWRGSIRYKYLYRGEMDTDAPSTIYVSRTWNNTNANNVSGTLDNYTSVSDAAASSVYNATADYKVPTGVQGACYRTGAVNPNPEFEVPFYSNWRFSPGKFNTAGEYSSYRGTWWAQGDETSVLDVFVATGEDFQVYFWTGMPPLYFELTAPAS